MPPINFPFIQLTVFQSFFSFALHLQFMEEVHFKYSEFIMGISDSELLHGNLVLQKKT
jgi:hypothetical protein